MPVFVWRNNEGAFLVRAKDQDEAFLKVIHAKAGKGATKEEKEAAERWFEHNDTLDEIIGTIK